MTSSIPLATEPYAGKIARLTPDSEGAPVPQVKAPANAPNILVIILDDVGFGSFGTFGGPVPTPGLDLVAQKGLRYNRFHTTALCSPTRAALLTGRNHHAVHMGGIPEQANGFPGYDTIIPPEAATVAQVLRMNGYATGCFGKWHLTPMWEMGPGGPFDRWPTGLGFDRFYGILGAESSQYEPPVYDQTTPVSPHLGRENYHLTEDLVDQAINWIDRVSVSSPGKPFFCYLPTPAVHAPHHAPREWIDKFAGQFDAGWDALRAEIFQRQIEMGVIPADTELTPRPEEIMSWDEYPDRYKPVASRLMEAFAGFLAHTDHHIHRLLTSLEDRGKLDNTLVFYITGDNGASGEGTLHGAWSAPSFQNGRPEDPEWLLEHMDDFGSADCENHYNYPWAWALDSPFQWMKQVASHFGGTRNAMAVSWPKGIADAGGMRTQFHHVVDIAPTIYEACGITQPNSVNGIEQMEVHGTSMAYTFDEANVEDRHETQYFEIMGNRGVYHRGWMASCFHGRPPWIRWQGMPFDGEQERWELYDLRTDFSQADDVAAQYPEKLAELMEVFDREARRNSVYPMRDPGSGSQLIAPVPSSLGDLTKMTYTSAHARMPEFNVVNVKNTSWRMTAVVEVSAGSHGVIACQGGNMAGWSLYLSEVGLPTFHYNWYGHQHTSVAAPTALTPGHHEIDMLFAYDGGFAAGGDVALSVDGVLVAEGHVPNTVPVIFSMSGETFDVGIDTGAPVGPYPHQFEFVGKIVGVTVERLGERPDAVLQAMRDGQIRASIASQ
jgi:arylsulfatase